MAAKQGPLRGLTAGHELMLYIVHGLLHQMGYEDSTVRGRARMHAREDYLLDLFGPGPAFYVPAKKPPKAPAKRKRK
jgi:probable rRNA maturation factor